MKRRKPYEFMAQPRKELEQVYRQMVTANLLPPASEEVEYWQEELAAHGIAIEPGFGWEQLAHDIRIVNLSLSDRISATRPGKAARAKQIRTIVATIRKAAKDIGELSMDPEVLSAALWLKNEFRPPVAEMLKFAQTYQDIAYELDTRPDKPRWREAAMRELRIEMACFLAPVFEKHFNQKAVPGGGSHFRELKDCNDWTKFFQSVAVAFWNERVTPDRQAVLWEAALPPYDVPADIRARHEGQQSDSA